jgi:hypothetical protein
MGYAAPASWILSGNSPDRKRAAGPAKSALGGARRSVIGSPTLSELGETPQQFKLCSECKRPIAFSADYYRCSVSTCNRKRMGLYFCSVACWDAHVPMMRHRDAWAEPTKAPTLQEYSTELREEEAAEERRQQNQSETQRMNDQTDKGRRVVGLSDEGMPKEVLIVVSKLKGYVKARSGMSTSDGVMELLSKHLRQLCDHAIDHAATAGRKTVMDRDFEAALRADRT